MDSTLDGRAITIIADVNQLERVFIRMQQREGIELAKQIHLNG